MIGNKDFWPAINNIGLIYEQGDVEAALKQQAALAIDRQQNLRWQWWRCIPKATANRV